MNNILKRRSGTLSLLVAIVGIFITIMLIKISSLNDHDAIQCINAFSNLNMRDKKRVYESNVTLAKYFDWNEIAKNILEDYKNEV